MPKENSMIRTSLSNERVVVRGNSSNLLVEASSTSSPLSRLSPSSQSERRTTTRGALSKPTNK